MLETTTAEQKWDKIKNKLFIDGVPDHFDKLVHKGFMESVSDEEKHLKLAYVLSLFKEIATRNKKSC